MTGRFYISGAMPRLTTLKPVIAELGKVERAPWQSGNERRTLTGRALQRRREALFAREPLCRKCKERGRVRAATQRDHIVPLFEGGPEDESNEQPLCDECHAEKTQQESKRARGYG